MVSTTDVKKVGSSSQGPRTINTIEEVPSRAELEEHSDTGTLSDSGHSATSMRLREVAAEAGPSTKRSRQVDGPESQEDVLKEVLVGDAEESIEDYVHVEDEPEPKRSKVLDEDVVEEEEVDPKKTKGTRKTSKGKGKSKA